jgi:hypothetical protein
MYFAHISVKGSVKYGQLPGSACILEALDKPMPIGEASCRGWDVNGLACWSLKVQSKGLPGLWVIINREFHTAQ